MALDPPKRNALMPFSLSPPQVSVLEPFRPCQQPSLLGLQPFQERELTQEEAVEHAWAAIAKHPDDLIALDRFGNVLLKSEHGERTACGWHIDHFPIPKAQRGKLVPGNVQALHWRTNCTLGGLLGADLQSL